MFLPTHVIERQNIQKSTKINFSIPNNQINYIINKEILMINKANCQPQCTHYTKPKGFL